MIQKGPIVRKVSRKGGRRPGAGRKPLPPEIALRNRVVLKLTDGEHAQLVEAAGDEPLATYVRRVLVRHLARRK